MFNDVVKAEAYTVEFGVGVQRTEGMEGTVFFAQENFDKSLVETIAHSEINNERHSDRKYDL